MMEKQKQIVSRAALRFLMRFDFKNGMITGVFNFKAKELLCG